MIKNKIAVLLYTLIGVSVVRAANTMPTCLQAGDESPAVIFKAYSEYLFDVRRTCRVMTADRIAEQMSVMTNLIRCVVNTNTFAEGTHDDRFSLMNAVLSIPAVKKDPEAITYCAQLILSVSAIPTGTYTQELNRAYTADVSIRGREPGQPGTIFKGKYWGPNLRAFHVRWNPILEHNRLCDQFRQRGIREIRAAIKDYSDEHGKEKGRELKSRIKMIDGLATHEQSAILGEDYPPQ